MLEPPGDSNQSSLEGHRSSQSTEVLLVTEQLNFSLCFPHSFTHSRMGCLLAQQTLETPDFTQRRLLPVSSLFQA